MVDLKIPSKSKGEEELQYLRSGLWRQLLDIVVLKSGGGFKFARSSTTVAARDAETVIKRRLITEMEAMDEYFE
ncbi:hypothetical protein JCGZ_09133 [Jatropha curcas]|uniref:Uncharacterized protein n=1 Tax=Jatropha curcas TaxID=180498 RepID=A0A067KRD6_JATCU|nr:hypothetical protein JCGZ_09133 [Jatropha curcas]